MISFEKALEIIQSIIPDSDFNSYDGIIVKQLAASNTLDEGKSNQTHIAITGSQMDIFPSIYADGYFVPNYQDKDESLKKYFVASVHVNLYESNIKMLADNPNDELFASFGFNNTGVVISHTSVVRSRRKEGGDQLQLSLLDKDDDSFVKFRKLIHTNDYLVFMKLSEKFEYDVFALHPDNSASVSGALADLNNQFFKRNTQTVTDVQRWTSIGQREQTEIEYTAETLGSVLRQMYDASSEERNQTAAIHVFGIKYGKEIIEKDLTSKEIVGAAGLNESYAIELTKGIKIYRCLEDNTFGIGLKENLTSDHYDHCERAIGGSNYLYYGVPGSGKSYAISGICSDEKVMERVVFHPDYAYADFVGQIIPRLNKDNKVEYAFNPGPFTKIMQKAYKDPENKYYLVIEEINRGNAPAIFGEIFQLLDRKSTGESEYGITNYDIAREVYDDPSHPVKIPSNLTLLATMNTSDQNVFTLDTAFQRRWDMKHIPNRFDNEHANDPIEGSVIDWGVFAQTINDIVVENSSEITGSGDKRLGAYFAKIEELKRDKFSEKVLKYLWDDAFRMDKHAVFDKRMTSLEKVLEAYQDKLGGGDPLKAVLDEAVYRKMTDKMNEKKNPPAETEV